MSILLNRIRLAGIELRAEQPMKRRQRRRRRRRILGELAQSLAGGAALHGLFGGLLWLAVWIMSQDDPIPWTVGSRAFWATVGGMALVLVPETVIGGVRLARQAAPLQLIDGRTLGLVVRFFADQVLLFYGAYLVVGRGAAERAIVVLIAVKVAVDVASEWLGVLLKRKRAGGPPGDTGPTDS